MELAAFSKRVQELRTRRGLSQSGLAKAAGLSVDTISRLERAQYHPTLETVVRLAQAFGLSVSAMFKKDLELPDELAALIRELPARDQHVAFAVLGALRTSRAIENDPDES